MTKPSIVDAASRLVLHILVVARFVASATPIALAMATNRASPRTPSKNRGKAITLTQQQVVHKCQFDSDNIKLFLQLVIAKMDAGNQQPCGLSMSGYKNVANKFLDKTSLLHSAKQMKNKYDNLKKDWVAWKKLEKARQGLTGLGYNQETGLFTAPDHWWAKLQAPGHDTIGKNVVDSSLFDDALPQSAVDGSANAKHRIVIALRWLNSFVFMLVDGRSMFLPIVYDMGNVCKVYKAVHGTVVSYAGLLK
ncbi:L10-interacting MYB domain-containing protein [Camellia lanceoleosa]|uniref:L10-interacting MYB domain-containing protein n=1 Tax=Camellia lanceoleosa TaxID=1840588 RepID=A0ACC0HWA9_9ERIC|nr:L10-interacting MYB domain-containing protein [Camellia lanceoleosa]